MVEEWVPVGRSQSYHLSRRQVLIEREREPPPSAPSPNPDVSLEGYQESRELDGYFVSVVQHPVSAEFHSAARAAHLTDDSKDVWLLLSSTGEHRLPHQGIASSSPNLRWIIGQPISCLSQPWTIVSRGACSGLSMQVDWRVNSRSGSTQYLLVCSKRNSK